MIEVEHVINLITTHIFYKISYACDTLKIMLVDTLFFQSYEHLIIDVKQILIEILINIIQSNKHNAIYMYTILYFFR